MRTQECPPTKICNICKVEKATIDFYIRKQHVQKFCLDCKRAKNRKHYHDNPEPYKAQAKGWATENKERRKEIAFKYDSSHREDKREYNAGRRSEANAARREQYAVAPEGIRRSTNDWYHANKDRPEVRAYRNEACAIRQRSLQDATPAWSNRRYTRAYYEEAQNRNDATGTKHNVDHIYPVQSDWVCGLHVPENLQIITAFENQSKGNRRVEDIVRP